MCSMSKGFAVMIKSRPNDIHKAVLVVINHLYQIYIFFVVTYDWNVKTGDVLFRDIFVTYRYLSVGTSGAPRFQTHKIMERIRCTYSFLHYYIFMRVFHSVSTFQPAK